MAAFEPILTINGDRVRVPKAAFDHEGFRAWLTGGEGLPEHLHATFVAGEVLIDMSPESIESHNKVKQAITIALGTFVAANELGELYVDGALLTNIDAGVSTEPDLLFATWHTIQTGKLRFNPKSGTDNEYVELEGTPDLVVEIVSDSSTRKDTKLLRAAYARAGIAEYWLIDARGENIQFEVLNLEGANYRTPESAAAPQWSQLLGVSLRLQRTLNRVARFNYTLEILPER